MRSSRTLSGGALGDLDRGCSSAWGYDAAWPGGSILSCRLAEISATWRGYMEEAYSTSFSRRSASAYNM